MLLLLHVNSLSRTRLSGYRSSSSSSSSFFCELLRLLWMLPNDVSNAAPRCFNVRSQSLHDCKCVVVCIGHFFLSSFSDMSWNIMSSSVMLPLHQQPYTLIRSSSPLAAIDSNSVLSINIWDRSSSFETSRLLIDCAYDERLEPFFSSLGRRRRR